MYIFSVIVHGDAGKLGKYPIRAVLPDKFARFLYEFNAFRYASLDLLPLPADRSYFDMHGALQPGQEPKLYHVSHVTALICIMSHISLPLSAVVTTKHYINYFHYSRII